MRSLFRGTPPGRTAEFHKEFKSIQKVLLGALSHEYARVIGMGLSVTGSFLHTLQNEDGTFNQKYKDLVGPFYDSVY